MRNVRHWSDSLVFVITADVRLTDGAVVEVDRRRCRASGPIYYYTGLWPCLCLCTSLTRRIPIEGTSPLKELPLSKQALSNALETTTATTTTITTIIIMCHRD